MSNSYNSDGQWPPTLPHAPHIIHPFNYRYCFENLLKAEQLVGGVDRSRLTVSPVETLKSILGLQENLVISKAERILSGENGTIDKNSAEKALGLIEKARDYSSLGDAKILYPAEYTTRAEALVAARRLVGGVEIEDVKSSSYIDDDTN